MTRTNSAEAATGLSPARMALFRELGDLKRIRSAAAPGSCAERLFLRAWAALSRGEAPAGIMRRTTAAALAAARLGDLDRTALQALGLDGAAATHVLEQGFDAVAEGFGDATRDLLRPGLAEGAPDAGVVPDFAKLLAAQPRAGVTCPGKPRIMLQPAENHAEHCLMVAVYGVITAGDTGADAESAFLAGLAHHLHNAAMPDSGYTGEILLGDHLMPVISRARDDVLATMPAPLADQVRTALAPIAGDETPEARAFHVADVVDRVLEIEQHLKTAQVTMGDVLGPYALVHASPVSAFHDRIVREAGWTA